MSKPLRHPTHGNNQTSPIHLVLHSPAPTVYTAGDRVRGVARVDPTSRPQRVKLSFTGHDSIGARKNNDIPVVTNNYYKKSFLNSNSFLNEELEFFFYSQELYASPTSEASFDIVSKGTAPDGRVELPFDFTFPPFVELPPPGPIDMWKGRPQFEHEPGHPLPPTYNFPPSTSSASLKQAIKYYLQAEIFSTSAEKPDHMVRQHLKYMMAAPTPTPLRIAEPDPNSNSKQAFHKFVKTHRLNPDCDDTGGVLRKVKKSLTKHEAPFARFNLYAQAPPMLVIGCNLPISIALEHLDRSPEIVEPPAVFLRRIRVQLESMLYIRLCNPHLSLRDGENLTFREDMDFRPDKIELVNKRFEFGGGELAYNGLQLADLIDTKLSQETVPSFKSYGLALQYRLRVEIWGECAKEKFEGLALSSAVQIISNMMMVEDAEVAALAASEAAGPPPPYAA